MLQVTYCRDGDAQSAAIDAFLINEPIQAAYMDETTAVEASALGYDDWVKFLQDQAQVMLQ